MSGVEPPPEVEPDLARGRRGLEHRVLLGGTLVVTALIFASSLLLEPDPRGLGTHEQLGLPPCGIAAFTGWPCPTCGVTTSVTLAARGDLAASFTTQPFGLLLALLLPLASTFAIVVHLRGRDLYRDVVRQHWPRWVGWLALALVVAWVWKLRQFRDGE